MDRGEVHEEAIESIEPTEATPARKRSTALSEDARLLTDFLKTIAVGQLATYADMSTLIGRNVRGLGALVTARRRSGAVWEAVPNRGLRRLSDIEIVAHRLPARVRHVGNAAGEGLREIATVDREALPEEKRAEHDAMLTILSGTKQLTAPRAVAGTIEWCREVGAALEQRDWLKNMQEAAAKEARARLLRGRA